MLVTISGTPYFSMHTWDEIYPTGAKTWSDIFTSTWKDLVEPYNNLVMATGPTIRDVVEDRSTADFTILDSSHAFFFEKGESVLIRDFNFQLIFGGFIEIASQSRISPDGIISWEISCTDNHYLADKRLVAKAFVAASTPTISDCVMWLVDNILDDEGITVGEINCSTAIEAVSFDYVSVATALDDLANYGDCTWFIDMERKLYFIPRTTYPAAWNITETSGVMTNVLWDSFRVTSSNPEYRNQQFIRGGYSRTAVQTEISKGDGEKSSFPVGYKIAEVPTISVSINSAPYVAKTVGIKGVDTGKDWYWSSNDQIIVQDVSGTRLTSNDKLKVVYTGLYEVVTSSANYAEIIKRQTMEGTGTGIVDSMKDDSLITTQQAGLDEANAILSHYADIGIKVEYLTILDDIEAGTIQHITSAIHGLDDDFLISQVEKVAEFYDLTAGSGLIKYRITAISGPVEDTWTKFFLKFRNAGNVGAMASSTSVVLILKSFTHQWQSTDTPNIWGCPVVSDAVQVDNARVPGFAAGDRVTYISLWNGGTERFRKYLTAQTESSTSIVTTFILASGEANFAWDSIKMFGGDAATDTTGSGVLLYSITNSYTKNSLESLQVVITDLHW
jgi:hypothetical protein